MDIQTLEQELRESRKREKQLQEYAGLVAHELKNPLAAMKVLADSLIQSDASKEMYREFMEDISSQIDREIRLIDELLLLAGMQQRTPALEMVDVKTLLDDLLKQYQWLAEQRKITLDCQCDEGLFVHSDSMLLGEICKNLLENAIKYNHTGGYVKIRAFRKENRCYLEVKDSGIGIPKEEQSRIFDYLYRINRKKSREIGGTGLGLYICKQAATLLGGEISVTSSEGIGSLFVLSLPV